MIRKKIEYGLILLAAAAMITTSLLIWRAPDESLAFYKGLIVRVSGQQYWTAAAIFASLYVLGPLLLVPVIILTLTSGVLFGAVPGAVLASLSALVSAILSFFLGKKFGGRWVRAKFARRSPYRDLDKAVARGGWKIVLLLRLTPFFPFAVVNFLLGAATVPLRQFASATWIGMLPGVIVYAYLGSLARSITELSFSGRELSVFEWGLSGLGALALIAFSLHLALYAKKALREQWAPGERTLPEDRPGGT